MERQTAYAIASVAVDLRIHELVDAPNWVVGAFCPTTSSARTGARHSGPSAQPGAP